MDNAIRVQADEKSAMPSGLTHRLRVALRWEALVFFIAAVVGSASIVAYSQTASTELRPRVLGMLFLFGAAAVVVGGLPGFLFGVPRTGASLESLGSSSPGGTAERTVTLGRTLPNTNLEQISDWLTKVLVGVTLGQLGNIGPGASRLFNTMSDALGVGDSTAFIGALVIYGAALGFMYGWLTARVWVAWTIAGLDAGDLPSGRPSVRP